MSTSARKQLSAAVDTLVHEETARVMDKARQGKETVQATVDEVKQLAKPAAGRLGRMKETVRQRPVPIAAVALGVLGVSVLLRRLLLRWGAGQR